MIFGLQQELMLSVTLQTKWTECDQLRVFYNDLPFCQYFRGQIKAFFYPFAECPSIMGFYTLKNIKYQIQMQVLILPPLEMIVNG